MKRYHLFNDGDIGGGMWSEVEEDPDGEWVRAEDALALERENAKLRAVIAALPRCDVCGKVATCSGWEAGDYDCDEHTGRYDDLPWADALRALESSRETKASGG